MTGACVLSRLRALPTVLEVLWWLTVVELGVRTLSLPRLSALLGTPLATAERAWSPEPLVVSPSERRRLRALDRLAARWPFSDGPCLRRALVAGHVLRRHAPVLRIGAGLDGSDLLAHAWVEVGAVTAGSPGGFGVLVAGRSA